MAANLLFVLYECPRPEEARGAAHTSHVVLTLHNERPIALPACGQEIFCPLETVAAELAYDPRTRDPCRFDQVCGVVSTARTSAAGALHASGSAFASASATRCEEEVPSAAGARFGFAAAVGGRAPAISDTALALALAAALVGITVVALLAWMVRHCVSLPFQAHFLPHSHGGSCVLADLIVPQAMSDASADQVARRDAAAGVGPQTLRTKTRTL